jgi:hypothetical protein
VKFSLQSHRYELMVMAILFKCGSFEPILVLKTCQAHIERAMQGNFLFQSLTEDQRHTLCGCMKRMDVCAGDIIIKQGSEGDLFYIVESGEFEVLVSQAWLIKPDVCLSSFVH